MALGTSPVQTKVATGTSAAPAVTFDSAPSAGNLLIFNIVADDYVGSTPGGYTFVAEAQGWVGNAVYVKVAGASDAGPHTFAIGSSTTWKIIALEWSGINTSTPVDKAVTATDQDTNTTIVTAASGTTDTANELLLAFIGCPKTENHLTDDAWTFSDSFTSAIQSVVNAEESIAIGQRIVSSTGSYQTTCTLARATTGTAVSTAVLVTFRQAASGPSVAVLANHYRMLRSA